MAEWSGVSIDSFIIKFKLNITMQIQIEDKIILS